MTIEEKARAYDEALSNMKDCIPDKDGYVCVRPCDIFSELQESEDERIRNRIYNYINVTLDDNESEEKEKWLTWLEKPKPLVKSEWTEDDVNTVQAILYTVRNSGFNLCCQVTNEKMCTWLMSLKQRIEQ